MPKYRVTLEIDAESIDDAFTVVCERVYFDEDYGFEYTIVDCNDLHEVSE